MASDSVSILVSNYNYGRFLRTCLDSVLAQDYSDLEVIVVDDASTDESADVLAGYASDPRVTVIRNEWNLGQAASMNRAFAASRGEYIGFLDSDDLWFGNKLSRCVGELAARPDVCFVQHPLEVIDGCGVAIIGQKLQSPIQAGVQDVVKMLFGKTLESCLTVGDLVKYSVEFYPTSGFFARRSALEQFFPLASNLRICADLELVRRGFLHGKVLTLTEPLGQYRVHGGNGWFTPSHRYARHEVQWQCYQSQYSELVGMGLCSEENRTIPHQASDLLWLCLDLVCAQRQCDLVLVGNGATKQPVPALGLLRIKRCAEIEEAPQSDVLLFTDPKGDSGEEIATRLLPERCQAVIGWSELACGQPVPPSRRKLSRVIVGFGRDGQVRIFPDHGGPNPYLAGLRMAASIWHGENGLPENWLYQALASQSYRNLMFGLDCQGYCETVQEERKRIGYMENSVSWRLTGWLRWIKKRFGKAK